MVSITVSKTVDFCSNQNVRANNNLRAIYMVALFLYTKMPFYMEGELIFYKEIGGIEYDTRTVKGIA